MAGQPQEPSWSPHPPAQQGYNQPPPPTQQQYGYPQQGQAPGYGPVYTEQPQSQPQYTPPGQGPGQAPGQAYGDQTQAFGTPGRPQDQGYVQDPAYQQEQAYPPDQGYPQWQGQGQDQSQWQAPAAQKFRAAKPAKKPRQGKGFVSSLFDFGFTSFVTPKIIKVLYGLVTVWTILWALAFLDIGFRYGHAAGGIIVLIIVDPILILVSLGVFRVVLEFFMVSFRMQEDLKALREQAQATNNESAADGA